ncbi:hypothetical protein BC829DRAFT_486487 [Chytridium lagenaria]|nr:hypothetical protein BC829DRAFT_486487 [Chytridium lagenaria]
MSRNQSNAKASRSEGKVLTLSKTGGYEVHTMAQQNEPQKEQIQGREHCQFYTKVGACRYGDQCGRGHFRPVASKVVMIPNMHQDPLLIPIGGLEELSDSLDAPDEEELQRRFTEFFEDAHPEFAAVGKVVQFKVCRNMVPHLRGNVFVQYEKEEDAAKAVEIFDGRYFGGRRLACELVPLSSWKTAICGVYDRRRCPKGDSCNFLHVFNNPGNLYREADFDWDPPRWAMNGGKDGKMVMIRMVGMMINRTEMAMKGEESLIGDVILINMTDQTETVLTDPITVKMLGQIKIMTVDSSASQIDTRIVKATGENVHPMIVTNVLIDRQYREPERSYDRHERHPRDVERPYDRHERREPDRDPRLDPARDRLPIEPVRAERPVERPASDRRASREPDKAHSHKSRSAHASDVSDDDLSGSASSGDEKRRHRRKSKKSSSKKDKKKTRHVRDDVDAGIGGSGDEFSDSEFSDVSESSGHSRRKKHKSKSKKRKSREESKDPESKKKRSKTKSSSSKRKKHRDESDLSD